MKVRLVLLEPGAKGWDFLMSYPRTESELEPAAALSESNSKSFKANLSKISNVLFDSLEATNTCWHFSVNSS